MDKNIGIFIVNYNMPERADALARHLTAHCKTADVILIDNGSDLMPRADLTNHHIMINVQTTKGWMVPLDIIKQLRVIDNLPPYKYYAFVITSAEILPNARDFVTPITDFMDRNPNTVGVHPALSEDSTTAWDHLKVRDLTENFRKTWMIDNIFSIYRASWFDSIGGFDTDLVYAWGIDLETCFLARQQGRDLYIYQPACVKKETDIAYNMNRMNMTAPERSSKAAENMETILSKKYGSNWFYQMTLIGVTDDLK